MTETQQTRDNTFQDRLTGILLGTAVGDSIGLPAEGLSPRRRQRLFPGPSRHRLLCGHGTGYVYHTVPMAVYAWLRHYGDFRATLEAAWDCGGDTDTVGAIVGALAGGTVGAGGIPADWTAGIIDWPRSVGLLRKVASQLARQKQDSRPLGPVRYFWPAALPRNLLFLIVVLLHGFRRLAPPY